ADPVDPFESRLAVAAGLEFSRGVAEFLETVEVASESARIGLADMAYSERMDEAIDRHAAPRLDRREEIAHRGLAEALAVFELGEGLRVAFGDRVDFGGRLDQSL